MSLLDTKQHTDTAKRYTASSEDLTYKQLTVASWFSRNETTVINIGRAILFIVAIGFFGYGLIGWIGYGAIGAIRDTANGVALVNSFQNYTAMQSRYSAAPLVFQPIEVLTAADNTYTLLSRVRNPNPNWMVEVLYQYRGAFGETSVARTFLMPEQDGVLTAYDISSAGGARNIQIDIIDLKWKRLNPHTMYDVQALVHSRLRFPISDVAIAPGNRSEERPSIVSFTITNDTAFNYVSVPYTVLLYAGNQIVDARPLIIDRFFAGESEMVAFNYGYDTLPTTDVVVLPEINVLDSTVYLDVSR